ncbi:MAG: hypothetical protein PHG31_00150 [Candidatus Omnitrophica bacterium]|nr:hypothetical protein [Candidatus Omnitrophota bacterium]
MADEVKQKEPNKVMGTVLKVLLGLAFLVIGVSTVWYWWYAVKLLIKGCFGLFFVLAGLVTLAIAKE